MVRFKLAATPLAMEVVFNPYKMQVKLPTAVLQVKDLPAAIAAAPPVAEMLTTFAIG
jgi:hypothetical protein